MNDTHSRAAARTVKPLVIARSFAAPRALVFKAWSSADHMRRWFSPEDCSVPEAEIDFRPGGACVVCMRLPDGQDHWMRGVFDEIAPPDRLAFSSEVTFADGRKFSARTVVRFEVEGMGTRMTVRQEYDFPDPSLLFAAEGAVEGWRTTLDKLAREVARIQATTPTVHGAFTIDRVFKAAPAQVFRALTEEAAKARWFEGVEGYSLLKREMDVRPGGREYVQGRWASGMVSTFDAHYFDVVPERRLVYAYEMHLGDRKISVSLATLELEPAPAGTRLKMTEQGAFLDGFEDGGGREHGTRLSLDRLAAAVEGA
jgi:uncharacterized protein YndB with AHSA1/START domain